MKKARLIAGLIAFCLFTISLPAQIDSLAQDTLDQISTVQNDPIELSTLGIISKENDIFFSSDNANGLAKITVNGEEKELNFENGQAQWDTDLSSKGRLAFIKYQKSGEEKLNLYHISNTRKGNRIRKIPLWLSVVPPLAAIILALIFKEVIISLSFGIFAGAFIAGGMRIESLYYFTLSIFEVVQKYVIEALTDSGHMSVIVFSLLIGGMVAIISKNGGMAGVVQSLSRYARGPRSAQFITWLLGVAIFFDDYANTLIVGNTMRSVTDRFKISREKLAYIVDSTAAPVSAIAFITTWIGAELGYIDDGMKMIALETNLTPYAIFLKSLKYSYYPVLTLCFILILIYFKREYGAMWHAEKRARSTGQVSSASVPEEDEPNMEDLSPVKNAPLRWANAAIPVLTVIFGTMYGLVDTGMSALYQELQGLNISGLTDSWASVWRNMNLVEPGANLNLFSKLGLLIGNSDSYVALLWASLSGVLIAIILTVGQRIMRLFDTMHWMVTGFKTMMPALIILTLAWSLAICTVELHTADFLSSALAGNLSPFLIPAIIFILAAFIAFSTGSSWSTMAILYPIAIPTTYAVATAAGVSPEVTLELLLNVIATVLAASVLGDHCSPISDTTILSSLASDCNHIDHVRTQLPYALTVGAVAIICVTLAAYLNGGAIVNFVLLLAGLGVLVIVVLKFGKPVPVE